MTCSAVGCLVVAPCFAVDTRFYLPREASLLAAECGSCMVGREWMVGVLRCPGVSSEVKRAGASQPFLYYREAFASFARSGFSQPLQLTKSHSTMNVNIRFVWLVCFCAVFLFWCCAKLSEEIGFRGSVFFFFVK